MNAHNRSQVPGHVLRPMPTLRLSADWSVRQYPVVGYERIVAINVCVVGGDNTTGLQTPGHVVGALWLSSGIDLWDSLPPYLQREEMNDIHHSCRWYRGFRAPR